MKKIFIMYALLSFSSAVLFCARENVNCAYEFDFDCGRDNDNKGESVSVGEAAAWLGAGALSTVKSLGSFFKNIDPHKAPEKQTILDTAYRKFNAVTGGQAVAAAKVGIRVAGVDEEKFWHYQNEDATYALINEVTSGEPVTSFQERRFRVKMNTIQDLVFMVLKAPNSPNSQAPEDIEPLKQLLDIAQQVIDNQQCMQMLPFCLATAIQEKASKLRESIQELGAIDALSEACEGCDDV